MNDTMSKRYVKQVQISSVQFSSVAQSCLTLSNSMDCSPPGSSVHGIFQARVLEWGAIAFSEHLHYAIHKQPLHQVRLNIYMLCVFIIHI